MAMRKKDLLDFLEEAYPGDRQEEWDNSGLEVGEVDGEVHRVLLALDLTEDVLAYAKDVGADFLLTHHPMIFRGIKTVTSKTLTGRRILFLIQNGMTYYATHTNYDKLTMAARSGERLNLLDARALVPEEDGEGYGRVGDLRTPCSLGCFAARVKDAFQLPSVIVYGDMERTVGRAAICTGSGKSFLPAVFASGADVYVTGDIDHHTALDAMAEGLCLIDATHFGTEYIFMEDMEEVLKEAFPGRLEILRYPVRFPYHVRGDEETKV